MADDIQVRFGGDAGGIRTAADQAKGTIQGFATTARGLNATARQSYNELKAAIDAANASLRQIQASAENTSTLATQARAVTVPYFDLGSSATISSVAFEVVGWLAGTAGPLGQDADSAALVSDFLANAQYGVGLPGSALSGAALFGASGDGTYQTYCAALGLGLSAALTDAETASAILARWLRLTNSAAVWSGARLRIIPYGGQPVTGMTHSGASMTYVPDVTPVYDLTDDFLVADGDDPVRIARSDPYGPPNGQRVECSDRSRGYTATTVEARDQGAIERYGLKVGGTITAREICAFSIGRLVAQLALQRALHPQHLHVPPVLRVLPPRVDGPS